MTETAVSYSLLYNLRTASYEKNNLRSSNPCEVCGREIQVGTGRLAVTDQGEFPVGSTCIKMVEKAGIPTIEDWR